MLGLIALALGWIAFEALSNLWTGEGDSSDSTYILFGVPVGALALAAVARAASLASARARFPLAILSAGLLLGVFILGIVREALDDDGDWVFALAAVVLALVCFGGEVAHTLRSSAHSRPSAAG